MNVRNAAGLVGSLLLVISCGEPTGSVTGLPTMSRARDVAHTPVAMDGPILRSRAHDLRVTNGHLVLDGVDHGRLSTKERARLDSVFHGTDATLAAMGLASSGGLSHVKRRSTRTAVPATPHSARPSVLAKPHAALPSSFFDQAKSAVHSGRSSSARNSTFAPTTRLSDIVDGGSWCDMHPDQCYWFLIDFQNAQDAYVQMKAGQESGFLEWVQGVGQDTFMDMFNNMMSEMAGDEAAAYAEALVGAFDFYQQVVDVYETEQLIQMYDMLNIDVWVGNTVGAFTGGWSIDCSDELDATEFSDICDDQFQYMM